MFAALKSLLSVHVAPGGSYVNYGPFSFAWWTRPTITASAGDDVVKLRERLLEVKRRLDGDDLNGGRELLDSVIDELGTQ